MQKFGHIIQDYLISLLQRKEDKMRIYRQTFMPGEWYILTDDQIDLERLVIFIKGNPGMKVELNLHQDFTGAAQSSDDQTWQLRAKEALIYLVSEGIEKSRVISNRFQFSPLPCFRLMSA